MTDETPKEYLQKNKTKAIPINSLRDKGIGNAFARESVTLSDALIAVEIARKEKGELIWPEIFENGRKQGAKEANRAVRKQTALAIREELENAREFNLTQQEGVIIPEAKYREIWKKWVKPVSKNDLVEPQNENNEYETGHNPDFNR